MSESLLTILKAAKIFNMQSERPDVILMEICVYAVVWVSDYTLILLT